MITTLSLKNFKKHKNIQLDFSESSNLIVGSNTSGKSTLLQAIAFGLYGPSCVPGKKDHLLSWGESSMAVDVGLRLGNLDYVVHRTMTSAEILQDGQLIVEGTRAVTDFIVDKLHMDGKEFMTFAYAPQGQTAGLLDYGASSLQKLIEKVAKVTIVDQLIVNLSADLSALTGQLFVLTPIDTEELNKQHSVLLSQLHLKKDFIEQAQDRLEQTTAQLVTTEEEYANGLKINSIRDAEIVRLGMVTTMLSKLEGELDSLKHKLTTYKVVNVEPLKDELDKLNAQIEASVVCKTRKDTLGKEQKHLVDERDKLTKYVEAHTAALPQLKKLQEEVRLLANQLSVKREELQSESKHLSQLQLSLQVSICSSCHRPYDNADLDNLKRSINAQSQIVSSMDSAAVGLSNQLDVKDKALKKVSSSLPPVSLEDANSRICAGDLRLQVIQGEMDMCLDIDPESLDMHVQRKKELASAILSAVREASDKSATESAIRNMETEIMGLKGNQQKLQMVAVQEKVDVDAIKGLRDKLNLKKDSLFSSIHSLELDLRDVINAVTLLKRQLKDGNAVNQEVAGLTKQSTTIKNLTTYLRDKRSEFLDRVWVSITATASNFCSGITNGTITQMRRDVEGSFLFTEAGRECPLSAASGFQRALLGVSLRLAIGRVLHGSTGFLMLDEPTAEMDAKNATIFHQSLAQMGVQTLVISHRDMDRMSAGNIIEL